MACYACRRCPENLNGCSMRRCIKCGKVLCAKCDEILYRRNENGVPQVLCEDCANLCENENEN